MVPYWSHLQDFQDFFEMDLHHSSVPVFSENVEQMVPMIFSFMKIILECFHIFLYLKASPLPPAPFQLIAGGRLQGLWAVNLLVVIHSFTAWWPTRGRRSCWQPGWLCREGEFQRYFSNGCCQGWQPRVPSLREHSQGRGHS